MIRRILVLLLLPTLAWAASYKSTVISLAPCHYYRLDETSGTTANDTSAGAGTNCSDGSAKNGVYTGGFTLNATSLLVGDSDPAVSLDGGATTVVKVNAGGASDDWTVNPTKGWSATALLKPASLQTGTFLAVADNAADGSNNSFRALIRAAGTFAACPMTCAGSCYIDLDGVGAYTANTKVHVVLVITSNATNSTKMEIYINGSSVGSATTSSGTQCTQTTTYAAYMGARTWVPQDYSGVMDEVAVWQTTLSAGNVTTLYTASITAPNSEAWWNITKRPELPPMRQDDYFAKYVERGYNTGLFSSSVEQPRVLNVGWPQFNVVPDGGP